MTKKPDHFEEQYLKGDLVLNKGLILFFAVCISILLIAGFFAAKTRTVKYEKLLSEKLSVLAEKHGSEIAGFTAEMRAAGLETETAVCPYSNCEKTYKCLNSDVANQFDLMLRDKFSYAAVGFTARVIFPHEDGGYFFFGPGVKNYNNVPYDMGYFESCAYELISKGTCSLDKESARSESIYSFYPIRDKSTGEVIAVLLARQTI